MRISDSDNVKDIVSEYDATVDLYDGVLMVSKYNVKSFGCMEIGLEYCSDPENGCFIDGVEIRKGGKVLVNIFYSDKELQMSTRFYEMLKKMRMLEHADKLGWSDAYKSLAKNFLDFNIKQYIMIYCGTLKDVSRAKITSVKILSYEQ